MSFRFATSMGFPVFANLQSLVKNFAGSLPKIKTHKSQDIAFAPSQMGYKMNLKKHITQPNFYKRVGSQQTMSVVVGVVPEERL